MRIHEYQAKKLLSEKAVKTPPSVVIEHLDDIPAALQKLGGEAWFVKAQVHAGGRKNAGGVVFCENPKKVEKAAAALLGKKIITPQTGKDGIFVPKILLETKIEIVREMYLALLMRGDGSMIVLASAAGGVDIEEIAHKTPQKIIEHAVSPTQKLDEKNIRKIAKRLGFSATAEAKFEKIVQALWEIFTEKEATLVEINPLGVSENHDFIALDCKIDFDDNALFRHPEICELADRSQENPREQTAREHGLSYVSMDGNIGCLVNGAGLAMATMDLIRQSGGAPANFLDVGGGTNAEHVAAALAIIHGEKNVRAVLVNIFGGIVRCDLIAEGLVAALQTVRTKLPMVVRLNGTKAAKGLAILKNAAHDLHIENDLARATKKAVRLAKSAND